MLNIILMGIERGLTQDHIEVLGEVFAKEITQRGTKTVYILSRDCRRADELAEYIGLRLNGSAIPIFSVTEMPRLVEDERVYDLDFYADRSDLIDKFRSSI